MPQFYSQAAEDIGQQLDAFTAAYVYALYFTDTGEEDQPPTDAELSSFALDAIKEDCADFQQQHADLLAQAYARESYGGPSQAGHDFWLTRNGHGVGFWDRDALDADDLGDKLTAACKLYSETYVTIGDDGLIYLD